MSFSEIARVTRTGIVYVCGRCGKKVRRDSLEALMELGWTVRTFEGVGVSRIVYFCSSTHMRDYHLTRLT